MFQVPRRTCAVALFALPLTPATLFANVVGTLSSARSVETRPALVPAGTIHGRVIDKESGQPVTAAQITVVGTSLGALTNNDGQYTINGVTAGQLTVRAARQLQDVALLEYVWALTMSDAAKRARVSEGHYRKLRQMLHNGVQYCLDNPRVGAPPHAAVLKPMARA